MPRSTDKTFLNHSTVRGYKYWPADHYTQETSEAVTVDVVQCDFCLVTLCILFSVLYIHLKSLVVLLLLAEQVLSRP